MSVSTRLTERRHERASSKVDQYDRARSFWDRAAKGYANRKVPDQDAYERKLAATQTYLDENSLVLEVGCGTGSTALRHSPWVAGILATDISSEMIALAKAKASAAGATNVSFARAGMTELDLEECQFDAVLALNVLHLVEQPGLVLAHLTKLLRAGGVLVLSIPFLADTMPLLPPVLRVLSYLHPIPPITSIGEKQFTNELERLGLTIVERWRPGKRASTFMVARKP